MPVSSSIAFRCVLCLCGVTLGVLFFVRVLRACFTLARFQHVWASVEYGLVDVCDFLLGPSDAFMHVSSIVLGFVMGAVGVTCYVACPFHVSWFSTHSVGGIFVGR